MTIIDILVKHANGDKLPKKFKYGGVFFKLNEYGYYTDEDGDSLVESISLDLSSLNEEVEIIEEDKKIEKMILDHEYYLPSEELTIDYEFKKFVLDELMVHYDKIDELIDEINKLKSK